MTSKQFNYIQSEKYIYIPLMQTNNLQRYFAQYTDANSKSFSKESISCYWL